MIEFQLSVSGGKYYPQFAVPNMEQALRGCLFVLYDLDCCNDWSLAIIDRDDRNFPTIHLQKVGDGIFLQVFISNEYSEKDKEGWCALYEDPEAADCTPFVLCDDPEFSAETFFEAGFAQNLAWNRKFLVSRALAVAKLEQFAEARIEKWIDGEGWINSGLI